MDIIGDALSQGRLSPDYHQIITRLSPDYHQIIARLSPDYHQIITRLSPDYRQIITRLSPDYHQNITRADCLQCILFSGIMSPGPHYLLARLCRGNYLGAPCPTTKSIQQYTVVFSSILKYTAVNSSTQQPRKLQSST